MAAKGVRRYNEADCIAALHRVAEKLGRTPFASTKGSNGYPSNRRRSEPTAAVIIYTFGSWNAALDAAGLPRNSHQPTDRMVANGFSARTYTDQELFDAVRGAGAKALVSKKAWKLTCRRYEELREDDWPCSALIRRRLRSSHGTWAEIVTALGFVSGRSNLPRHTRGRRAA